MEFFSLAEAYESGLRAVLSGDRVNSVMDPMSKASNFGKGNRSSRELLSYLFAVNSPVNCLVSGPVVKLHLPYCFGLLAFTLSGSNRLDVLHYYRPGAADYSDDGWTLSGAFGSRIRGIDGQVDQLAAVLRRLSADPTSRRTYSAIIRAEDNLIPSREYPCAAGIQLFLRDDRLMMLAVMRAQQAFTVLPYDAFLFMAMQLILAAHLGVYAGTYMHFSGTFHVYDAEESAVVETLSSGVKSAKLPSPPSGASASARFVKEFIALEGRLRKCAEAGDRQGVMRYLNTEGEGKLFNVAKAVLGSFALTKIGLLDDALEVTRQLPSDIRSLS